MSAGRFLELNRPFVRKIIRITAGLAFVGALSTTTTEAAQIAWHNDLQAAARQSAAQHKPLLVVVGARWCGPCHKMQSETFPNPAVAARISRNFIPVKIDADAQAAAVAKLQVDSFPTVLVISPEGRVVGRMTGFQSAAQLDARLASYQPSSVPPARFLASRSPIVFKNTAVAAPPSPIVFHETAGPAKASFHDRIWAAIKTQSPDQPRTTLEAAEAFSLR